MVDFGSVLKKDTQMDEVFGRCIAGRYRICGPAKNGGMGVVYPAFDERLERHVAIKVLSSSLAKDAEFLKRFHREAKAAASLEHPNIVSVHDMGEEALEDIEGPVRVPYIVMEYVDGLTVRDLLRGGKSISIDEAVRIMAAVLSALECMHAKGIVHRDIKPSNVMITPDKKVKVLDLGIARLMKDSQTVLTQPGAVIGTAQYMSPEQARGENVDVRSDIYSAGCLLFELLTGSPPFRGDTTMEVVNRHLSEIPRLPSSVAASVPTNLDEVVMTAMKKDPILRYSTADLMRKALFRAAKDSSARTSKFSKQDSPATAATTPVEPALGTKVFGRTEQEYYDLARELAKRIGRFQARWIGRFQARWRYLIRLVLFVVLVIASVFVYLKWDSAEPEIVAEPPSPADSEKVGESSNSTDSEKTIGPKDSVEPEILEEPPSFAEPEIIDIGEPQSLPGSGPERETYTMERPAAHVVFNSITNNSSYEAGNGDERNFLTCFGSDNKTKDVIVVRDKEIYTCVGYVHNNVSANMDLVAENTSALVSVPEGEAASKTVQMTIRSTNAQPKTVYDRVTFQNAGGFTLSYVPRSAHYDTVNGNFVIPDALVNGSGALLGCESMNGEIPGDFSCASYLFFEVQAETN